MEEIIVKLQYLDFPFTLTDMNLFMESLNSPTQIRYNTMEWLFTLMEKDICTTLFPNNNSSMEERLIVLFDFFNLDETKDNILGYSTAINNNKTFLNLLNFTIKYQNLKQSTPIFNLELEKILKFLEIILNNKIDIFNKNIRLFVSLKEKNVSDEKINLKKINEMIDNCKAIIEKVENKLSKLKDIKINENTDQKNIYDKLELKKLLNVFEVNLNDFLSDFNGFYEKEIKYIPPDIISHLDERNTELLNEYNKIENIASSLEEIFAIHNKIIENK